MSTRRPRLVAALVMMAAVLVAYSASALGAPVQERPAVGRSVGPQTAGVYDAALPKVVPVVDGGTAGSLATVARIAAAHVYDAPVGSRVGASVSFPAESPFSRVTAGKHGAISPPGGVEGDYYPLAADLYPKPCSDRANGQSWGLPSRHDDVSAA